MQPILGGAVEPTRRQGSPGLVRRVRKGDTPAVGEPAEYATVVDERVVARAASVSAVGSASSRNRSTSIGHSVLSGLVSVSRFSIWGRNRRSALTSPMSVSRARVPRSRRAT